MEQQVAPVIAPVGRRMIAISYRDKEIHRDGIVVEQRPTMVLIKQGQHAKEVTLEDEDHELCFLGRRRLELPPQKEGGKPVVIDYTEIGISAGDVVVTMMGGSGAFFAFALSRQLEKLGEGGVYWIGSTLFKRLCDQHKLERSKLKAIDDEGRRIEHTFDHCALAKLFELAPQQFHPVSARERDLILLSDVVRRRKEAMDNRMACAHRVRGRLKKLTYCGNDVYPEGSVKVAIEQGVANDAMLKLLMKEEHQIESELKKLLHTLDVWKVFAPIEGVGELTAAPLIVAIGDINRFPSESNLKAFLGMHNLKSDGTKFQKGDRAEPGTAIFARRREGQLSNWHPEGRQALYLIADQFLLWRQKSPWGQVAKKVKEHFLAVHPTPQVWVKDKDDVVIRKADLLPGKVKRIQGGWEVAREDGTTEAIHGVTRYNPAHINRMTKWRTMTLFVEWLYHAWKAADAGEPAPPLPYSQESEARRTAEREARYAT